MTRKISLLVFMLSIAVSITGTSASGAESGGKTFPFGIGTPGGRGGRIIKVTNLNAEGPGSLRAALEQKGPRIVVFEVGGVIDLKKEIIIVNEPFLTIAGQTAPAPGVTLIRGSLLLRRTHDVIIQHIAVRPGDAGQAKKSGWEVDAISTYKAYNVLIDHCSGTWATDENMSVSGPRDKMGGKTSHDVTFMNCIIAEGLWNSTHKKGKHSRGSLVMDGCSRIGFIGNLFAHNYRRHPYCKGGSSGVVVNNVMVNPGNACVLMTKRGHSKYHAAARFAVVGNVMVPGANTEKGLAMIDGKTRNVYARDNVIRQNDGKTTEVGPMHENREPWPEGLEALPSNKVFEYVLKNAGMRPAERDKVDSRIIREAREGKGRIIDSQDEVGGYPDYPMTRRKLQIPENNVQQWLDRMTDKVEN